MTRPMTNSTYCEWTNLPSTVSPLPSVDRCADDAFLVALQTPTRACWPLPSQLLLRSRTTYAANSSRLRSSTSPPLLDIPFNCRTSLTTPTFVHSFRIAGHASLTIYDMCSRFMLPPSLSKSRPSDQPTQIPLPLLNLEALAPAHPAALPPARALQIPLAAIAAAMEDPGTR